MNLLIPDQKSTQKIKFIAVTYLSHCLMRNWHGQQKKLTHFLYDKRFLQKQDESAQLWVNKRRFSQSQTALKNVLPFEQRHLTRTFIKNTENAVPLFPDCFMVLKDNCVLKLLQFYQFGFFT